MDIWPCSAVYPEKFDLFLFFVLSHSVLSPILNMPISDSKRQRVLVTACVLYSEVSSSLNQIGMLNDVLVSNLHAATGNCHLPVFCF